MGCVFVAGIGVGGTLSTFRLAVQNSVPFRLVGAATSALQFCRLMSGTTGLAVLGVVLSRSLWTRLDEALPERVRRIAGGASRRHQGRPSSAGGSGCGRPVQRPLASGLPAFPVFHVPIPTILMAN